MFDAPEDFDVLFIQGGAMLQFAMVAMNLLRPGQRAGYVNTGTWAKGAIADAGHYGEVYTAWDGASEGYARTPDDSEIEVRDGTRYLHITSNETIGGIRFPAFPVVSVPLVADMSSEMMARRIPWDRFDLVYGGVQKNLGPAGMAMVFIRQSAMPPANESIARYLRYDVHLDTRSLFNTPPMFTIAMVGKVLKWMKNKGGLDVIEREAAEKAAVLYRQVDESDGFYSCPVAPASRSHMNVVFRLPSEALESRFLDEAKSADLLNLKGHRSVGGCRASIYNAMPRAGVEALADLMGRFRAAHH